MHGNEVLTTFTIAAALGVGLFSLAHALRISAITVLLIGGVLAGPEVLGIVKPAVLGDGLGLIISLAVALVLFEGGLTLDLKGYRTAGKEIFRLLTIGVLVTWLGGAFLVWVLFRFDLAFCLLAASLVIVTGPTVIGPLLHRIRVKDRLHHILHWEGVLIDPIGVFIALLCFEFYVSTDGDHQLVLTDFLMRFFTGVVLGIVSGGLLYQVLQREWIPEGHTNIFVLVMAMLTYGMSDLIISESGLLSVTVAGLVLGSRNSPRLRSIVSYKVELKDLFIGLLFILLAANLQLAPFLNGGWRIFAVVTGIILIIRPLNIWLALRGSTLDWNEKLFLSWIAPRGIVAASMASVFTLQLDQAGDPNAFFLESFTYSVIVGTVLVQGSTAGLVARLLQVSKPPATGWLIIGANQVGLGVARYLKSRGVSAVVVDTNSRGVRSAIREDLPAICEDAMLMDPDGHVELYGCGNLLALTPNLDLNRMLCRRWSEILDGAVYRWEPSGFETEGNRHLLAGIRIWDAFPLNRWMVTEDEPVPLAIREQGAPLFDGECALMSSDDGNIKINVSPVASASSSEVGGGVRLVYLPSRSSRQFKLPLAPERVIFSDQDDLYGLYGEMLELLHVSQPQLKSKNLLEELWDREREFTSLVGHGIALPHFWTQQVESSYMVVARPRSNVVCNRTKASIKLVFMLASPQGKPEEHLRHLATVARLVANQTHRSRLFSAQTPQELYETISSLA